MRSSAMKFCVQKTVSTTSRLGSIVFEDRVISTCNDKLNHSDSDSLDNRIDSSRGKTFQYETPLCLQYTQFGSIPHINWDSVGDIEDNNSPALMSLRNTIDMKNSVKGQNEKTSYTGIAQFVGMNISESLSKASSVSIRSRPSFLTIDDPLMPNKSGYNTTTHVGVFARSGKKSVNADEYMDVVNDFVPSAYQALCDSDTPFGCPKKRIQNSVDRSLYFLDKCIELEDGKLKQQIGGDNGESMKGKAPLFASIQGGCCSHSRTRSVKETLKRQVDGFVIEGLAPLSDTPSETLANADFDIKLKSCILSDTLALLPTNKPRAMFGCFRPDTVLHLIHHGVDLFDSSYATFISNKGQALLPVIDVKKMILKNTLIDLNNKELFQEDFSVLSDGCDCYSCSHNFTKAYINHLLNCKEMLAQVLLMFHNLQVYYAFFESVRTIMKQDDGQDKLNQLISQIK